MGRSEGQLLRAGGGCDKGGRRRTSCQHELPQGDPRAGSAISTTSFLLVTLLASPSHTTSKKRYMYLVHLVSDTLAAFVRQPSGQACRPRSAHSNALCPIKKLEGVGSWRPETCSSRVDGLPETNSTSRWTCSMTTPAACSRCSFCSLQALRRCCSCWSV